MPWEYLKEEVAELMVCYSQAIGKLPVGVYIIKSPVGLEEDAGKKRRRQKRYRERNKEILKLKARKYWSEGFGKKRNESKRAKRLYCSDSPDSSNHVVGGTA